MYQPRYVGPRQCAVANFTFFCASRPSGPIARQQMGGLHLTGPPFKGSVQNSLFHLLDPLTRRGQCASQWFSPATPRNTAVAGHAMPRLFLMVGSLRVTQGCTNQALRKVCIENAGELHLPFGAKGVTHPPTHHPPTSTTSVTSRSTLPRNLRVREHVVVQSRLWSTGLHDFYFPSVIPFEQTHSIRFYKTVLNSRSRDSEFLILVEIRDEPHISEVFCCLCALGHS